MVSQWIETENGNVAASFDTHKRIINNVTLALPHAGVYAAATDPINGILQPSELLGIGEYSIKASVASPVVNVMCVNMTEDELSPLVYTQFPNARKNRTGWHEQEKPVVDTWWTDIPVVSPTEWLNRTVVDDIFKWGEKYSRRPPVFALVRGPLSLRFHRDIDRNIRRSIRCPKIFALMIASVSHRL